MAGYSDNPSAKLPAFMFYPGDWMKDPALRGCSSAARGLWMDLICLMWESVKRGHLVLRNGKPAQPEHISRMTGVFMDELPKLIAELEECGVLSRTAEGVIYSRRMVRDEVKRAACSEAGKRGGNPKLTTQRKAAGYIYAIAKEGEPAIKIGASENPEKRALAASGSLKGGGNHVLAKWPVRVMGTAEAFLHDHFKAKKAFGEWFFLKTEDIATIEGLLSAEGCLKGTPNGAPENESVNENESPALLKGKFDAATADLPGHLAASSEFLAAWSDWCRVRRSKRKPISEDAFREQMRALAGVSPDVAVDAIRTAIANDWQGLFPKASPSRKQTVADRNAESVDKVREVLNARQTGNAQGVLRLATDANGSGGDAGVA